MKYSQYKATTSRVEKQIINDWMLMFPLKEVKEEGQPRYEAQMPTLLGNILRTYENYPMSRYNISSVFFWPIFWLTVDKDNRKEIDEQWVVADCLLYMSFISAIYSILYALLFVADIISGWLGYYIISVPDLISKNFTHTSYLFTAIYLCLIVFLIFASRFLYILSLPHHVKNGGFYQAIYDLNRHKIKEVIYIKEDDNDFWNQAWAYLQYKLVKCKKCGRFADKNSLRDAVCERCFEIDESSEISGGQDREVKSAKTSTSERAPLTQGEPLGS